MSQVFYANRAAVYKAEKKKRSEMLQVIGDAFFCLMLLFMKNSDEMIYSFAKDYKTLPSKVESWMTGFLIFFAIMMVISIVLFIKNKEEYDKLMQSYVEINDDSVYGTAVALGTVDLYPFSCTLDEIVHVASVGNEGVNLIISTERETYSCYQIENAAMAASYLNKARATSEQKTGNNEVITRARNSESSSYKKTVAFCKCCGNTMSEGETVCSQCGAIDQIVDEVIPIIEGEYLTCPICGQSKMRNNRSVCYNCGVKFKK